MASQKYEESIRDSLSTAELALKVRESELARVAESFSAGRGNWSQRDVDTYRANVERQRDVRDAFSDALGLAVAGKSDREIKAFLDPMLELIRSSSYDFTLK